MNQFVTARQLAAPPAVSLATVYRWSRTGEPPHYRWSRTGELPHVRVGRTVRFDPQAVQAWLAAKATSTRQDT